MAVINDLSDLVKLQTNGSAQHLNVFVDSRFDSSPATAPIVGQLTSLWRYNKSNGANGEIPAGSEAPNRATLGALKQANPTAGKELWLLGVEAVCTQAGAFILYDRLFHSRALTGNNTSPQGVGAAALTRNTGGVGNQIWLEIWSAIGSTATTISVTYINSEGVSRVSPLVAIGGTGIREEARLIRVPLADSDVGVQSVTSVTLTASTGAAGEFGVIIARPLTRGYIEGQCCACFRDLLSGVPAMVTIDNDACLSLAWYAASITAPRLDLTLHMVEK